MRERYREKADSCRALADELHDRPEGPFLLNAAYAYDRLADDYVLETQEPFVGGSRVQLSN